ncbi:hypothetical protein [Magnetospira sp. QH-2]|uniref:hypothetical protein n=1 Tax=Magnetospira sp. (strain QH-2) TaxID=1288970 RepID=UPI0003E80BF2|nr:hypothetical protein [Magnetospira sp. QH-2]CCQ72319.1 conserved protein of unknown function [Magnetospira sp. QH-2]
MARKTTIRRRKGPDLDTVRDRLSSLLPPLMENAAISYQAFAALDPPEDAKGFSAHHAACKSALAHLDLLAKLARWASGKEEVPAAGTDESDETIRLLADAQAALAEFADGDDEEDDLS